MAEGYGEQIARVEDLKKQAEGKTVLLTPLQGITESARKGEQSLKSLSPKLKSDEAKKYLAASVPRVNNYLKGIADKGFNIIRIKKEQTIEQGDVAPLNQLRSSLLSSLDEQKTELDNIDRLEQQDAQLKALEQKEKEIDGDKELKLEEKIKTYGDIHKSANELSGKLVRNLLTAEGAKLLQSIEQNGKKAQERIGYKLIDLNIALKCREKYAKYVKVDDKGNITYSDSFLAMKKDNPAEYRRIMNEILKGVTGVQDKEGADFMKIESELAALRSKVDAYKKAVEEFEKNPTPETRHQLKESRPQLPYPGFPGSKERADLKVPGGEFLNDVYSTIDRVSVPYKKMQEDMASLDKRVEKKEEEQNKEMVKQLIDALDKNWNETVKPKQTEYGTFKTTSLPDYLFILSLDEKLVTPDMKAKRESYKGTYDKVSEELLRCMLAVENMVSPFMSKNLDAASREKIMAKYKEAEKNVNEIESDRIRIQSTTTLKTITQPGATNLLSYVIWKPQGPDGKNYDINEEMLANVPAAQRDLIRSQIRLAIANNREAVQAQTEKANQEILTPDPKLVIAKLREQYGEKAKTYFDALQLFESGDLNAAAKGLRDFIVYYDTLSPADKLTLAPLLGEAREKVKLVAIRQVAILESLEADIRAVYSPLQAAVRQGRDNAFTAEQRNQISTEEMAVMAALGVLKKRVQEGQATDITDLLDSIRQKLAKGANRYGLIEKINTMFQAQNDLHSSDPAKKAAAIAELQKFADKATNMDTRLYDIGKKYLNMILEQDKKEAEQEANSKGYTREEITQQILASPQAMASIKALAKQYYDQFLKENPGAKDKISIEQAEQFVLRRKTDEFYQETLQRYMSQSPKWKDNTSVKMYNKWFPADRANFWEVWNYSLEEQHAFADECAKLTFESILTLPVGMGAGAVGKMVTRMALRGMLKMAGERAGLEAGLLMMERGGLMALRAGSAEMQMLSPALRAAVMNNSTRAALGAMGTAAWGSGVIAEGATMRALGDASSFLSSGQIPLYLQAESTENHMDFSHALTESMVKVMLFRFMGSAGQGLFGAGMRAGGASAITANLGMETFSGAGGAAIELAFMSPEERAKNGMNPSFWVKSILQNAIVSAGTHLAHGTGKGEKGPVRESVLEDISGTPKPREKVAVKPGEKAVAKPEPTAPSAETTRVKTELEAAKGKARAARDAGHPDPALEAEVFRLERRAGIQEAKDVVERYRKAMDDPNTPPKERERMRRLVNEFDSYETAQRNLNRGASGYVNEERYVDIPDPNDPSKTRRVNLLEGLKSKNFAYSPEMVDLMNNHERLMKEGPVIVKHGGDEIMVVHAGPDGKVQIFFGDIGNMGPTNEFSLRIKGQNGNMVDLYLSEFTQILKKSFRPGQEVNGAAMLEQIKTSLSKKFFGIETQAQFEALKKQYNLEGNWQEYQDNMHSAKILAGFRNSARGLQNEFLESSGNSKRHGDSVTDSAEFGNFVENKINAIDHGVPPLVKIMQENFQTFLDSGAFKDLIPTLQKTEGSVNGNALTPARLQEIINKPALNRTTEERLILYYALKRVNGQRVPPGQGYNPAEVGQRFQGIYQPDSASALMDIQMAGIEVPHFRNRPFNSTDMKFFLDHVLEETLHQAKEHKGENRIFYGDSPFDSEGNIRSDHPRREKLEQQYKDAATDQKPAKVRDYLENIEKGQRLMDQLLQEIRKLTQKENITEADIKRINDLKREYQEVQKKVNQERFKDSETGTDRPLKFDQDIDGWCQDRGGTPIRRENRILREFTVDLNNTGAINSQHGYQATDLIMASISRYMVSKFPGISAISRTGGGQFKIYFMDSSLVPHSEGGMVSLSSHEAILRSFMPELNALIQEQLKATTATNVDGIVRNATGAFRNRSNLAERVGEVVLHSPYEVTNAEFNERAVRRNPRTPITLAQIRNNQ